MGLTRVGAGVAVAAALAGALHAQEFQPPQVAAEQSGTRIALLGFGARGGLDFTGSDQLVVGMALDLGQLFTRRLRLRPSGELGVGSGATTYVGSLEALFRFAGDDAPAIPYVGAGASVAGEERCDSTPGCPAVWLNVAIGFELPFRSTFNWLLEYHGMDALRRHRFYIGLTTRRGS
jgi:hypothetical protein